MGWLRALGPHAQHAEDNRPPAPLRHAVVGGVENVSEDLKTKPSSRLLEGAILGGTEQLGDVLHDEDLRAAGLKDSYVLAPESTTLHPYVIPVEGRETLARRATDDYVSLRDCLDGLDRTGDHLRLGKVRAVGLSGSRVGIDRETRYKRTSLGQPEREPSTAGEEIDRPERHRPATY
jgi:hypothetical protein